MSKRTKCRAARRRPSPAISGGSRGPILRVVGATSSIYIDGDVGPETNAALVREQIVAVGEAKEIEVRINSDGGEVSEGMAIYHTLRRSSARKVGIVEGIAASMASVILQACDERVMTRGSYVMIHNPQAGVQGEAKDMTRVSELLTKMREDMLDIYEARTGIARAEISKLMDAETYMTAEEAVELGFADSIADEDASIVERAVARLDRKKLPKAMLAKLEKSKMDEEEMKAKIAALEEENAKLKAKMEESDEETEEEESPAEDTEDEPHSEEEDDEKEEAKAKAVAALVRRITGKKSLDEIEGSLMALTSAQSVQASAARKSRVDALVSAGKLAPVSKKWALSCSAKALSAYEKAMGDSVVVPVGKTFTPPKGDSQSTDLSASEKTVAKAMGITEKQALKARALKIENGKVSA